MDKNYIFRESKNSMTVRVLLDTSAIIAICRTPVYNDIFNVFSSFGTTDIVYNELKSLYDDAKYNSDMYRSCRNGIDCLSDNNFGSMNEEKVVETDIDYNREKDIGERSISRYIRENPETIDLVLMYDNEARYDSGYKSLGTVTDKYNIGLELPSRAIYLLYEQAIDTEAYGYLDKSQVCFIASKHIAEGEGWCDNYVTKKGIPFECDNI